MSERGHILGEEDQWGTGKGGWSRCSRSDMLGELAHLVSEGRLRTNEVKGRLFGAPTIASCAGLRAFVFRTAGLWRVFEKLEPRGAPLKPRAERRKDLRWKQAEGRTRDSGPRGSARNREVPEGKCWQA